MFGKEKLTKFDVYFDDEDGHRKFYTCLESSKEKAEKVTKKKFKEATNIKAHQAL